MEENEKKIAELEAALKIAKLKIWGTFIVGIFMTIVLAAVGFYYGSTTTSTIRYFATNNNNLVIPLGDLPEGYGGRIPQDNIASVNTGFINYNDMLNQGKVIIPNSSNSPDTFRLDSVYSKYEIISIEALAQMLKQGQKLNSSTLEVIQPAYILIRDSKMDMSNSSFPKVKKYLMMLDSEFNIIRDPQNRVIYYNDLRRCPPDCPAPTL